MKYKIEILRCKSPFDEPYLETFDLETEESELSVANAINLINKTTEDKIMWECACMQKKCGACAMVINGTPGLACDVKLKNIAGKDAIIRLEPLKKFPILKDLVVDRTILHENLKEINAWLGVESYAKEKKNDLLYEASKCLQCGCCLEVCPNFYVGGKFFGVASMVPLSRILEEIPKEEKKKLRKKYNKHFYNGCGKSLACRKVCPAQIDIDRLLVNSNAIAFWKYIFS